MPMRPHGLIGIFLFLLIENIQTQSLKDITTTKDYLSLINVQPSDSQDKQNQGNALNS